MKSGDGGKYKRTNNKSPRAAKKRMDSSEDSDGNATAAQKAYIKRLDPQMTVAGLDFKQASALIEFLKGLK